VEVAVPVVSSSQDESSARSLIPPIQDHQPRTGRDSSIASTSQELWGSLTAYMRSRQLGPVLAVALVAIIILMQASFFFWILCSLVSSYIQNLNAVALVPIMN
jgi:hypothetical protein